MNTTLIEEIGVTELKRFFQKTKMIRPIIKTVDKYPIWDGELIIYNDQNYNKDNIKFRIPVQVKAELLKQEKKSKETYSINVSDLEKYSTEGGVLFIKVIYNEDKDESYFYMKNIMKGDIYDIIRNNKKGNVSKTIELKEIVHSDIIPLCMNFNLHRELQMQIPLITFEKINNNEAIHTFGYINQINDIVKNEQYAYIKTNLGTYAYVGKVNIELLFRTDKVAVSTKNKKYYDNVVQIIEKDKIIIKLNDYVRVSENRLFIDNDIILESTLDKAIYDLEFILDLYENKTIRFADEDYIDFKFSCDDKKIEERIAALENNLKYLRGAANVLTRLKCPLNKVLLKDVIEDEEDVCKVDQIVNNGYLMKLEDINSKTVINPINILGHVFLIYFVEQENGIYKGYDFIHDEFVYKNLVVEEDERVQLSRYFNLPSDILARLFIDEKEIVKEIKQCTKNDITNTYINNLMLEFIKAYDLNNDKNYLNIATEINKILRKQRNFYNEDLYKINKYQILKRLGKLTKDDENIIRRMKLDDTKDKTLKCSCAILLEDYDEFNIYFEHLDSETKKVYSSWAIYNLMTLSKM